MEQKTEIIQIRLNSEQKRKAKNRAVELGFKSLSEYVRTTILGKGGNIEQKIKEIHKSVIGNED